MGKEEPEQTVPRDGTGGFQYDLLPTIFKRYDKNLKIYILRLLVDEFEDSNFNPYTRESLLRSLVLTLKKTCRLQEFHYYNSELAKYDNNINENEEYEVMFQKTKSKQEFCEDMKDLVERVYYAQDDSVPTRDRRDAANKEKIIAIEEEYEDKNGEYRVRYKLASEQVEDRALSEVHDSVQNFKMRYHMDDLFQFCRALFDLGRTDHVFVFLKLFSNLYEHFRDDRDPLDNLTFQQKNSEKYEQALWGIICCQLVAGEISDEWVKKLRTVWDERAKDERAKRDGELPLAEMGKKRSWLLHWNIFQNLLNERPGQTIEALLEALLEDNNKATILSICPWLLRYVAFCAICSSKPLGPKITECAEKICPMLQQQLTTYKDPLTEFLRCLFVESDFDKTSRHLRECRELITVDIFLCSHCNIFFSQARLLLFSRYSMVNMRMELDKIGELLMLGKHQEMPDNAIWSVGPQPVHYEKRSLTQWITQTVRELQKEQLRQTSEDEDTGRPTYNIRIDLREGMLLTKPTYANEFAELLKTKRLQYMDAKGYADGLG